MLACRAVCRWHPPSSAFRQSVCYRHHRRLPYLQPHLRAINPSSPSMWVVVCVLNAFDLPLACFSAPPFLTRSLILGESSGTLAVLRIGTFQTQGRCVKIDFDRKIYTLPIRSHHHLLFSISLAASYLPPVCLLPPLPLFVCPCHFVLCLSCLVNDCVQG